MAEARLLNLLKILEILEILKIPLIAGPSITSNFTFIGDFWVERHTLAECALEEHLLISC